MLSALHTVLYLVGYMIWADGELLSACAQLTQEEMHRDLGCSHTCVFGTLQHMFIANYDWLARLRRQKLILHVCNHATLHRGQVAGMFRQLGHQPPSTDLSTYHWGP